MDQTQRITIDITPPYDVLIGRGLLDGAGRYIADQIGPCRLAVITDSNVAPLYLESLVQSLTAAGFEVTSHIFQAGEAQKTMATLGALLEVLAQAQLTRRDAVIALGGGVCGDMAGFAAGCYLRGIRYVQIPTTLLASVDSSVGGKTAVDLKAGKNLAGLFHQPSAVLCDIRTLQTLPPAVFADGMAEAIKTGILSGEALFGQCDHPRDELDLAAIITACVAYKGAVVAEDEFETGRRKTLNLGHTAGHAVERCSDYFISHGQAVAMGMVLIARAGEKLGWTMPGLAGRISRTLEQQGLPTVTPFSAEALARAALHDKKRGGDEITLVVPVQVGECILRTIPVSELAAVFAAGLEDQDGP